MMRQLPWKPELPERDIETERAITRALDECRPHLQVDGGDIELVRYEAETQTAEVRFLGACSDCPLVLMTLRAGIERLVQMRVPSVRRLELVR